jgi:cytidine deaminase
MTPEAEKELLVKAWAALENAYAPYSRFSVGSAVLTETGEVFSGANMECSSFSDGVCAEKNAMGAAVTAGHRTFRAIAVVTRAPRPAAPCGGCRQLLGEFGPDILVVYANEGETKRSPLRDLLPDMFSGDVLLKLQS